MEFKEKLGLLGVITAILLIISIFLFNPVFGGNGIMLGDFILINKRVMLIIGIILYVLSGGITIFMASVIDIEVEFSLKYVLILFFVTLVLGFGTLLLFNFGWKFDINWWHIISLSFSYQLFFNVYYLIYKIFF